MLYTHHHMSHGSRLLDAVRSSYSQRLFPDITLVAGDRRIACHRLVLASMCPYFHTMFHSGMREATEREIVLRGVEPIVVERVVEYLYTGKVEINADLAPALLQAADMYDLQDLRTGCVDFYTNNITRDTCLAIWKLGAELGDKYLKQAAFKTACDNFTYVVDNLEDFLELSVEDLADYLASEYLQVDSEEQVFDAALKWLKANEKSADHFHRVVCKLRLTSIDPKVLDKKYLTKKELYVDRQVAGLLQVAINHQLHHTELPYSLNQSGERFHGDTCHKLVILGGSQQTMRGDHYSVNTVQALVSHGMTEEVTSLHYNLPTHAGSSHLASCYVRDLLYISGLGEYSNELWTYNAETITWHLGPKLLTGRWGHEMVVGPGFQVYVLGGYSSLKALSSIETLKTQTSMNQKISGKWKDMGNLATPIGAFSALYHGDSIYTFGGQQNFNENLDIIQKFDLDTKTCSVLEVKLPVSSGANRLVTWGCFGILVDAMATVVINLETLDKLTSGSAGKLCIEYDKLKNPLFGVGPGVGLQGFSMNRIGESVFITGGEMMRGTQGTGTYSREVLKGQVQSIVKCDDRDRGWFQILTPNLRDPLAYHTATVVTGNRSVNKS